MQLLKTSFRSESEPRREVSQLSQLQRPVVERYIGDTVPVANLATVTFDVGYRTLR